MTYAPDRPSSPDEPADVEDVDLVLRHITRQFPDALVRALAPDARAYEACGWLDTQVAARQRRLDRVLEARVDGQRRRFHLEWQLRWQDDVPFRVYEYHTLLALALHAEAPDSSGPAIESRVVLLSGRDKPWPTCHTYATSPPGAPFSGVRFAVEAVYQRRVAELTARGPLWSIFAPLAVDADGARLAEVVASLRQSLSRPAFAELGAAMTALGEADGRQRGLGDVVVSLLGDEVIMHNAIYRMGEDRGREQGEVRVLERQLVRRLGRSLTEAEQGVFRQRLAELGAERLSDVVLELASPALAAWLADPSAR